MAETPPPEPGELRRMAWLVAAARCTLAIQGAALLAGCVGAIWHGPPAVALGAIVASVLALAKPKPP